MENRNIIIILLVIIVILVASIGFVLMSSTSAKEPTKVKITSFREQYEGGELSIQLTCLNKTPISNEIVNITITNSKGKVVVDDVVKTNSKGIAKWDLDLKKGKYTVNVTYGGNENYTGNNTTQKLTIKEKDVVETNYEESAPAPETTEFYSSSQDNVQSGSIEGVDYEVFEGEINGPEDLPYPIRAEDDWHGMRM